MQKSIAIALAWPETFCKQTGAWYDKPADFLGISQNHTYKVGHSAFVLINPENGKCHYFDFGRYHAPYDYGRVRDEVTDHELKINTKAELDENLNLINYQDIIDEIQLNPASHGDGQLYAGITEVDFQKTYQEAKKMQAQGVIVYGPFILKGTNCSRFVRTILMKGTLSMALKFKLRFPWTLSPRPIGIVKNLKNQRKARLNKPDIQSIFVKA